MKKYNMIIDTTQRKFLVKCEGRFNEEESISFITEYKEKHQILQPMLMK